MPIYEYQCRKCGNQFEVMRRLSAMDEAAPCPACKSKRTQRRVSAFSAPRGGSSDFGDMGDLGGDDFGGMGGDDFGGGDWDDDDYY